MRRALVQGLSLSNIIYLRAWSEMLLCNPEAGFFRKLEFAPAQYLALMLNVTLLGLAIAGIIMLAPKFSARVRSAFLFAGIVLALWAIRSALANYLPMLRSGLLEYIRLSYLAALLAIASIVLFTLTAKRLKRMTAIAAFSVSGLAPLVLVTFPLGLLACLRPTANAVDAATPLFGDKRPPLRVMWILFDEWDQRLTFLDRRSDIRLPVLDSLKTRSFTAMAATSPAAATVDSIPALLSGHPSRIGELNSQATVISWVKERGWNAAVAGWFLPYCRIFADTVNTCYWDEMYKQANSSRHTLTGALLDQPRSLIETSMFSPFGLSLVSARHRDEYSQLLASARQFAADPRLGLAFVHFNTPHAPHFAGARDYWSSLMLVDSTIGELLNALTASGLDHNTALVISSDHWLRSSRSLDGKEDHHVPFLVSLPKADSGIQYSRPINTIITRYLVQALMQGEITTLPAVQDWIDRHARESLTLGANPPQDPIALLSPTEQGTR